MIIEKKKKKNDIIKKGNDIISFNLEITSTGVTTTTAKPKFWGQL